MDRRAWDGERSCAARRWSHVEDLGARRHTVDVVTRLLGVIF